MGQPKPNSDVVKLSARYPADVLENPKPIAQRFAHSADLRQAPLRRTEPPTASPPAGPPAPMRGATASAGGRLAFRTRLLFVGLILAALVPSLVLAALGLGLIGMPGSEAVVAVPAPQPPAPSAVLTAPDRIEAIAGENVSFPIALDGTDGVPPRSVVAIKGLPPGSNFSEGRPYGDSEWNLKPDQIGDLHLILPGHILLGHANGEFRLGIALIGPDDQVIAEAETLLEIAPAPAPVEQAAPVASGLPSPDGSEAAASAPVPDAGHGAELEETPTTMEVATAPSGDPPPDKIEQTMESGTAPAGDTPPNTLGKAEDGESGLGTVQPSMFVNLREWPSSSSAVLGVIAKDVKLPVLDRKRGWVQVTDPATGKNGWIYSGLLVGEAKPHYRRKRAAPAAAESKSESFWSRLGGWLSPSAGN